MRTILRLTIASFFILCAAAAAFAQESDFSLGQGRVGEPYQQSIQKILVETYGVRLESGSQTPAFEWAPAESLPPGLTMSADGTVSGVPRAHQEQPYRVRVKVTDRSMRDAEALELNLSIKVLPPRIRLVRSNAPRLVPVNRPPGQAVADNATPGAATSGAAEGNGDGNGASASPARVAARPETPEPMPTPAATVAAEPAAPRADADAAQPQDTQNNGGVSQEVDINEYVNVFEQTSGGNKFTLNVARDRVQSVAQRFSTDPRLPQQIPKEIPNIAKAQLDRLNFRLRADHESTIAVYMAKATTGGNGSDGVKLRVSAQLLHDGAPTPVNIFGDPVNGVPPATQAALPTGPLLAELESEGSTATINLKKANAQAGDTLVVVVEAFKGNGNQIAGTRSFDIELTNYGWEAGVSPSLFLLNRQRVRNDDIQPTLPTTPGETQLTNTINPVNYSPFPGVNYTFTYKGTKREKTDLWKRLQPGFGINATFMDFNDQTVSVQQAFQTLENRILSEQSDVQLGLGAVVTLFSNKLQITYGSNLSVDRKRAYFGVGVDFLKLLGILQ